jgi:hypothetical protein
MNRGAALFTVTAILCSSILVFATAQQGDRLLLGRKGYSIYTNPLEPYLQDNPGKLPKSDVVSTALWRGYVATWKVENDRFLLVDVAILRSVSHPGEPGSSTEFSSVMSAMFPGEREVLASWFSGHVIIPDGKLVNYVHMGYASTYEKYILLRVEKGVITRKWATDVRGFIKFRDEQFAAYKKTEEYRKALAEVSKEGSITQDQNEEFLREFYSGRYMSMIFDVPR